MYPSPEFVQALIDDAHRRAAGNRRVRQARRPRPRRQGVARRLRSALRRAGRRVRPAGS